MNDILEHAEKMLSGVTPGPWKVGGPPWNQIIWSSAENRVAFMAHSNGLNDDMDIATAQFIAWAREAVPALANEIKRLQAKTAQAADAAENPPTEYERKVMQMKEDFPNGV